MFRKQLCAQSLRGVLLGVCISLVGCSNGGLSNNALVAASSDAKQHVHDLPKGKDCSFKLRAKNTTYCRVSIYAIFANPEIFYERYVFTYASLEVFEDGKATLFTGSAKKGVPDSISCLIVQEINNRDKISGIDVSEAGLYSVAIGGKLEPPHGDLCAGVLRNAIISEIGPGD